MIALSTISMIVIEIVSEAKAIGPPRARACPSAAAASCERVAEEERERDGEGDRRHVGPAERGADDHPEHLADGAAREAVHGRAEGEPVERLRHDRRKTEIRRGAARCS